MIMMSNERANERQLTFSSAPFDDNNVRPGRVGGEGGWDLCDILVRENGIIKYLFFIYDPLRRRTPTRRREDACIQVLECRSCCMHIIYTTLLYYSQKKDGDKIITTTMFDELLNNYKQRVTRQGSANNYIACVVYFVRVSTVKNKIGTENRSINVIYCYYYNNL